MKALLDIDEKQGGARTAGARHGAQLKPYEL